MVVDVPVHTQGGAGDREPGMPEEQVRARINAQASREQRRAVADIIIDDSGTEEELDARVAEVWEELQRRLHSR